MNPASFLNKICVDLFPKWFETGNLQAFNIPSCLKRIQASLGISWERSWAVVIVIPSNPRESQQTFDRDSIWYLSGSPFVYHRSSHGICSRYCFLVRSLLMMLTLTLCTLSLILWRLSISATSLISISIYHPIAVPSTRRVPPLATPQIVSPTTFAEILERTIPPTHCKGLVSVTTNSMTAEICFRYGNVSST